MEAMAEEITDRIRRDIAEHPILVYMKGDATFPQCGFSGTVVRILQQLGADFETRDVLLDPELRDAIKRFSNWPTIPQVYVRGEFVGGCDIVRELYESGELAEMLKKAAER
jgi:monothiol glutaredoxin